MDNIFHHFNIDTLLQCGDYRTLAELRKRFMKRKHVTQFNSSARKRDSQSDILCKRRDSKEREKKKNSADDELWNEVMLNMATPHSKCETDSSVEGSMYDCIVPGQSSEDERDSYQMPVDKSGKTTDQLSAGIDELSEVISNDTDKGNNISRHEPHDICQHNLSSQLKSDSSGQLVPHHKTINKSQGLVIKTPGDGSCFYHAIARQIELKKSNTHIHILDLPSVIGKKRNEYAVKNAVLSQTQLKTSAYIRKWINEFILSNTDILLNLFDDPLLLTESERPLETLKTNARRAISSKDWAGNEQVYAFSLLTMTPFYMWTESTDTDCYVRAINTTHQLERLQVMAENDPELKKRLSDIYSKHAIHNTNNAAINIFYHSHHYMTFVNYSE